VTARPAARAHVRPVRMSTVRRAEISVTERKTRYAPCRHLPDRRDLLTHVK
jgi:hypothetical protein